MIPRLRVVDLMVRRGAFVVLNAVDITLERGRALGVLGRNGAGKTTLAEAISGLLPSASGEVRLDGEQIRHLRADRVAQRGVALVPEGRKLFWNMTVRENLAIGAHRQRWWWGGPRPEDFDFVWSLFPPLAALRDRKAHTLSGGEQQMVAIARALMSRPKLLILDEPTSGLAPQAVEAIVEQLVALRGQEFSTLLVEQSADVALDVCDDIALLGGGRIVASGPANEVSRSAQFADVLFGGFGVGGDARSEAREVPR